MSLEYDDAASGGSPSINKKKPVRSCTCMKGLFLLSLLALSVFAVAGLATGEVHYIQNCYVTSTVIKACYPACHQTIYTYYCTVTAVTYDDDTCEETGSGSYDFGGEMVDGYPPSTSSPTPSCCSVSDFDGDGQDGSKSAQACGGGGGGGTDCDDKDPDTSLGAPEICGDDKDNSCNGVNNEDCDRLACPKPEKGDPLDLFSGIYYYTEADIGYPSPSMVRAVRHYKTNVVDIGPFGRGTNFNYDQSLVTKISNLWVPAGSGGGSNEATVQMIYRDDLGRRYLLSDNGDGSFSIPGMVYLKDAKAYQNPFGYPAGYRMLAFGNGKIYIFNEMGLIVKQIYPGGYAVNIARDAGGKIVTVSDTFGRNLNFSMTATTVGGLSRSVIESITDDLGNSVSYTYDVGLLNSVTWTDGSGSAGEKTVTYHYDSSKKVDYVIDPEGVQIAVNSYDEKGRVIRQSHEDGGEFSINYTESGGFLIGAEVTSPPPSITTRYSFDTSAYVTGITELDSGNPTGYTTSYYREPVNRQLSEVANPLNEITTYGYNEDGLVNSITDPAGNRTEYFYEQYPDVLKPTKIKRPLSGVETSLSYDSSGNLTSILRPGASAPVTATYTGTGLLKSVTDEEGTSLYFDYDGQGMLNSVAHEHLGVLASLEYDDIGRLTKYIDARGDLTSFDYFNLGHIVNSTGPLGGVTTFEYDLNGNLVSVTDAKGHSITYRYNSRENVDLMTDQLLANESYSFVNGTDVYYDRPYEMVDRNGKTTRYTYGNVDRTFRADYIDDGGYDEYLFDAAKRLYRAENSTAGAVSFIYTDPSTDHFAGRVKAALSDEGVVNYTYDVLGRRKSMNIAGQPVINYDYQTSGLVNSISMDHPAHGLLDFTFTYDDVGRRETLTYPNGVVASYGYDAAGRLLSIQYKKGAEVIESVSYAYDENGNRTRMERPDVSPFSGGETESAYDAANRALDLNGEGLLHDNNGNLTHMGDTVFAWDQRDRLVAIANTPAGDASFVYDALGRRVEKTVGGVTTKYLFDGLDVVREMDGAGVEKAFYIRTLNIDEPLARLGADGTIRFYHADGLGSVIALTDENGVVKTRYNYSPFGITEMLGEASDNPFKYTGREDDGTGLYYYRARYYSPLMGRFISEDPIRFAGGDVNWYAYVGNSPTNFVDPLGLFFRLPWQIYNEGHEETARRYPGQNRSRHNNEADAFRHCYTSCIATVEYGEGVASALGCFNEWKGDLQGQTSGEKRMDTINNEVGRTFGSRSSGDLNCSIKCYEAGKSGMTINIP